MLWGEVELEPEVRDWYLALDDDDQARVGFHIDRLAQEGPLLTNRTPNSWTASSANSGSISEAERHGSRTG